MQTLGLSTESKRSDGRLKSLLWPTVENAWDVDYLSQQGFWICLTLAIINMIFPIMTGNLIMILGGIFAFSVYFLGGMGVREKSWLASVAIFICYLQDTLIIIARGFLFSVFGALHIVFLAILLSNIRATFLASEWKQPSEEEDRPMRFSETFRDKLVDVYPAKLWPILKIPFLVLAAIAILFYTIAIIELIVLRMGLTLAHPVR